MGIGIGACCCTTTPTPPRWTPPAPTPGECEYEPFCENDPNTVTLGIDITVIESDNPCFTDCDTCPASGFELVLSPYSGGGFSFSPDCTTLESDLGDVDTWLNECNDTCVWGDFWGYSSISRLCETVEPDEFICPSPPSYPTAGAVIGSGSNLLVFVRIFRDGCIKVVTLLTIDSSSITTDPKPDPTDPVWTPGGGGCLSTSLETYEGTISCCGTSSPGAGPYSEVCTSPVADQCVPSCSQAITMPFTMYC